MKKLLLSSALLALLAACSTVPPESEVAPASSAGQAGNLAEQPLRVPDLGSMRDTKPRALAGKFQQANWSALPGWQSDDLHLVWKAFVNNCKGLMRPVSGSLALPARATPRVWQPVCAAVLQSGIAVGNPDTAQVRRFLQEHLQPWRLLDPAGHPAKNMVTGYYEPLIHASRTRQGAYQWPLYAAPADLLTVDLGAVYPELAGKRVRGKLVGNRVVPYDTRAQIASSPTQPPVIVWANDPVDAFFLQIQGSGRVVFDDGSLARIAYAGENGQPYNAIGRTLIADGELTRENVSLQSIRAWLLAHPDKARAVMETNRSYIFFREAPLGDTTLGSPGALGVALTPLASLAVDPRLNTLGAPFFVAAGGPDPVHGILIAQDVGGAIRGPVRGDIFFGFGTDAERRAGAMKAPGRLFVLLPKALAARIGDGGVYGAGA